MDFLKSWSNYLLSGSFFLSWNPILLKFALSKKDTVFIWLQPEMCGFPKCHFTIASECQMRYLKSLQILLIFFFWKVHRNLKQHQFPSYLLQNGCVRSRSNWWHLVITDRNGSAVTSYNMPHKSRRRLKRTTNHISLCRENTPITISDTLNYATCKLVNQRQSLIH